MPAAMTADMIRASVLSVPAPAASALARPVAAKVYATLLIGPPRSEHIMRPRMMPSGTSAEVPPAR